MKYEINILFLIFYNFFKLIFIYLQWKYHYTCYFQLGNINKDLIQLYGFTQDPNTLDYIVVMKYAEKGSLRKNLQDIVKDKWIRTNEKIVILKSFDKSSNLNEEFLNEVLNKHFIFNFL